MAVGTAAAVLPIKSITRKSTNEKFSYGSEPGKCTTQIYAALKDIMVGKAEDPCGWLMQVQAEDLNIGA